MATLGDIVTRIEGYLLDEVPVVEGNIRDWVKHGSRIAQESYSFRGMKARFSQVTSQGVRELVNTPSDWKDFRKSELPYFRDEVQRRQFVEWIGAEEARDWYTSDPVVDKGQPQHIQREEDYDADSSTAIDRLVIFPYPDGLGPEANGEYDIQIPYFRYLPSLANDTESDWFTNNAEWFLTFYGTAEGLFQLREEERALVYGRKAGIDVATGSPLIVNGRFTGELGRVISTDKKIAALPSRTLDLRLDAGYG